MQIQEFLAEANVIGTAVGRREIPAKYRQYPIIGQGSTSIVLEKDPNTVLVLTRDHQKVEWLIHDWGLGLGRVVDEFDAGSPHHALREIPVLVVEMPKLFPLDPPHKKALKLMIKKFQDVWLRSVGSHGWKENSFQRVYSKFTDEHPDHPITRVLEWAANYDIKQINFDFLMRNFMQTTTGEIIAVDPVVGSELHGILMNIRKMRYERDNPPRGY